MQQHFDRQTESANVSNITEDNVWYAAADSWRDTSPISSKAPKLMQCLAQPRKQHGRQAENESPNLPQTEAKLWFQKLVQTTLTPKLVESHKVQQPTI
jgi:hypothetical protein